MKRGVTLAVEGGAVVCEDCRVAASFLARARGLLGRSGLGEREGLLIRRTSAVHTHFMRFPIDVVFLDREGRVVRVVPELAPWRFARARGGAAVLELPAGAARRAGLVRGSHLTEHPSDLPAGQARPPFRLA